MPAKELFTIYASNTSNSTDTSGPLVLQSDAWNGSVGHIRLPLGSTFKVWEERVTGPKTDVYLEVSYDTGSTYRQYAHSTTVGMSGQVAAVSWDVQRSGRPAHLITTDLSSNTKLIKWRYEQGTFSTAQVMFNCEITTDV